MQAIYKRSSVIAGFGLLLLVLLANAFVTRSRLGVQIEDQIKVSSTEQFLLELSQTESVLKDAETGQRGFLYTGDPKYLEPYNAAIAQVEPHIQRLAQMAIDDPHQQARISLLRALAQKKLSELAQTISLYRSGKADEANALVMSDLGRTVMNQIRDIVDETQQEQISLSSAQTDAYRRSTQATITSLYLASLLGALGLILLAYYVLREMQLREEHAAEIRRREEWFRVTLTSIGDAVIATDERGQVTFLNPLAEKLMGVSLGEIRGKPVQEVFPIFSEYTHQPAENPVEKVMELGLVVGLANHTVLQNSDGTLIPIEDSAAPIRDDHNNLIGVVLVFRDATRERKSQELLRKTEKLNAAARLAATVAHEINNPLEAVGNLIYLAKTTPALPAEASEQLILAEQELERVSHITRQTLGFYRDSRLPDWIELPTLLESVLKLHSNKFKAKQVTLERSYDECPPVHGFSGELKQLIANLVSNAADAVNAGGTIRVQLSCADSDYGKAVRIRIEDDGPGIADENMDRIFEPFFTTKEEVGTGLGLWISKEIVERHGGSLHANSRNGHGSSGAVFTVTLPCASKVRESVIRGVNGLAQSS
jgi:PAS domain S-box-containing protein